MGHLLRFIQTVLIEIIYKVWMSNFPVKGTTRDRKSKTIEDYDEQMHIDESMRLLDQLFEARLVDHISRPVDKKIKEEHIDMYRIKLASLHDRLRKILNDAHEKSTQSTNNTKNRSAMGSVSLRPQDWGKLVRNVETRYS